MPKISTYEVVAPVSSDLVLITDVSDSNNTRSATVGSLGVTVYSGYYTEIFNQTSTVTTITGINTFVKISGTTTTGLTNNANLVTTSNRITNQTGASMTFIATYSISANTGTNNQNLMFRLVINGNATSVTKSEADIVTSSNTKVSSTSNTALITLANGEYVELWVANATAITNVTVEHFNLVLRQI